MPTFVFNFTFPKMDADRREHTVRSWGGTLGTAFNRAWKTLRKQDKYQNIRKLGQDGMYVGMAVEEDT